MDTIRTYTTENVIAQAQTALHRTRTIIDAHIYEGFDLGRMTIDQLINQRNGLRDLITKLKESDDVITQMPEWFMEV